MIRMSTTITMIAHNGAYGSQTKLRMAETAAAMMPAMRAQVWPRSRAMPIASNARPTRRWITPQTVTSKA